MTPAIAEVLEGKRRWALVCADNREILPTLLAKSISSTICDPPYEAQAHTKQRRVRRGNEPLSFEPLSFEPLSFEKRSAAAAEIGRVTRRWAVVFSQAEAVVMWSDALVSGGMNARRIGVWVKPDGMPQYSGDRPGMGYESIVFSHAKGRSEWNGGGRSSVFVHNKQTPGGKHFHETQKPLPLMMELVELFTDPDEVVLDPFAGSATTGVACLRLGRRFIGIEKDAAFAQVARERLEAEGQGLTLRAARAGQMPLFGVAP